MQKPWRQAHVIIRMRSIVQTFVLRVLIASACCMLSQAYAASGLCENAGLPSSTCSEPEIGSWDIWRFVLNNKSGAPRGSETAAVNDAIAALTKTYPCGLSYAVADAPYTESGKTLSWTAREDAPRISYAGFVSGANGNCQMSTPESTGAIVIRRERRVRCPRGYGWLMRDDLPTVCVKD
ncbi:MAG: hypothetical protein JWL63_3582 [Rhodocyclales bacterium]|nr:hypothetical protein [Rhodocyclales bacterium]